MKNLLIFLCCLLPVVAFSQETKPAYCNELPVSYEKGAWSAKGGKVVSKKPSLPKFKTTPVKEYKVQVAILKFTSPENYPFHESLIARHRPCEEVWVIETKESFKTRAEADRFKNKLKKLGYTGAYLIEMVGWE